MASYLASLVASLASFLSFLGALRCCLAAPSRPLVYGAHNAFKSRIGRPIWTVVCPPRLSSSLAASQRLKPKNELGAVPSPRQSCQARKQTTLGPKGQLERVGGAA